ncbi:acyltransferase [Emticicia sp. W12TSBA100-4]|uniref:acyltransferase n=1 Tax=Emticicia sp. W12TSBA100-4 TaxID=3160965 RepID=UPI0033064555
MHSILSIIISRLKNEKFKFDNKIPISYLIRFFIERIIMFLYGKILFPNRNRCFIHPSSIVRCRSKISFGNNFTIGRSCFVDALSINGFKCGENVSMGIYTHVCLTGSLKNLALGISIGNNVGLGSHGHYGSGVGGLQIGDDTIIGNYVSFHPETHNYSDLDVPIRLQGVQGNGIIIGKNCWIGAKATFLDGANVGDGCIVAAGSVVKGEFPPNTIIGGVPAKVLKMRVN